MVGEFYKKFFTVYVTVLKAWLSTKMQPIFMNPFGLAMIKEKFLVMPKAFDSSSERSPRHFEDT